MRKFFKKLLAAICVVFISIPMFAESDSVTIGLTTDQQEDKEEEDFPSKGYRKPSAPIFCTIDFNNHRINAYIPYEILSYQIWDEEGEYMIASYVCDSDMVAFLSTVSGVYQFRIATTETIYIGYIEL